MNQNPFVPAPQELDVAQVKREEHERRAAARAVRRHGRDVLRGGPTAPILTVTPPDQPVLYRLPAWSGPAPALWLVGVHGRAGVGSLLRQLPAGYALRAPGWPTIHGGVCRVVVMARSDRAGLDRLELALREWASGALAGVVELAGVVVTDDAPKVPRELREQVERVAAMAPVLWRVRWIEAWRTLPPDEQQPSQQMLRITASILDDTPAEPAREPVGPRLDDPGAPFSPDAPARNGAARTSASSDSRWRLTPQQPEPPVDGRRSGLSRKISQPAAQGKGFS